MEKSMIIKSTKEYLNKIFEEVPEEQFSIVKIVLKGAKNNRKLQIFVDKKRGITIDDCVMITKKLSKFIDNDEKFDEHFILEVSSPGESDVKDKEAQR